MEWEQLSQGVGRGQLVGRRVASPSEQRVCGHLMVMTAGSRAPRKEGKPLQMEGLLVRRGLGGRILEGRNHRNSKLRREGRSAALLVASQTGGMVKVNIFKQNYLPLYGRLHSS